MFIKRKLANNKKELQATKGGPCKIIELSALEEQAVQLTGINTTVEGISEGISFGVPHSSLQVTPTASHSTKEAELTSADESEEESRPRKRKTPSRISTFSFLQPQVEMQKEFHSAVKQSLEENVSALQELVDLKKKALEEEKRHNAAMEKLYIEKLRVKQRILELQLEHVSKNR